MGWDDYHMFEFQIHDVCISADEEEHNLAENNFKKLYQSPDFIKMLGQTKLKNGFADLDVNKLNKILKEQEKNKKAVVYKPKSKISTLLHSEKQRFGYLYDFGDNWEHTLAVEKVLDSADAPFIPFCLGGERACPPEDCGGVGGYERILEVLKTGEDPGGEDVQELKEWIGDWDPERFDLDEVNKKIS